MSRATFHWIPLDDHVRCYEAVRAVLRPGGVFHAESGGAGNVDRLITVLDQAAGALGLSPASTTFLTAGTAFELLQQAGFAPGPEAVRTVAQRRPFTPEGLLEVIRTQSIHAYRVGADDLRSGFVVEVGRRFGGLRRPDGTWDQTFVRLEVLVERPSGQRRRRHSVAGAEPDYRR